MLVSVIIPLYNRENTIKKAAESVLNQTYKDLELIIVDDCSTDHSVDVVKNMMEEDSRIRLILSEQNGGACVARNKGIDAANGDVVAFHDSDDIWHPDKLEKSIAAMERENADMVFSALNRVECTGMHNEKRIIPEYNLNKFSNKFAQVLLNNCISTQTIVIKSDILKFVRFDEDFPRFQDWDFSLQVLKNHANVFFINEALVDCYLMPDSITASFVKGDNAYRLMEKKYAVELREYPRSASILYRDWGYQLERHGENGSAMYKKSFIAQPTMVAFVRFVLSKVRLYRMSENAFGLIKDKLKLGK